ncbi:GNAT family N-acetyltransferase [Crenobacter sp. SG2305]|uniref:GNAT family N-acetyltransferase n=1 Tax=Crenobacter oryzisoli TaxID=3056844 RepID=UPI0025AA36CC|nr:GNAT family N-acetyltransferase [Crenobacter sp. SG2305]MDN0082655.1 GNAT family N-acetyltransferase [Crenobacter sp. SG2305]
MEHGFTLRPYRPDLRTDWDTVVRQAKNATFLHLRDFIDYHADRFDERSLLVYQDEQAVAALPCTCHGDTIISHGGLPYAGLLYGTELRAAEVLAIFDAIGQHFRAQGIARFHYKAVPHIYQAYPAEEDGYALFRHGARLVRRDLSSAIWLPERLKYATLRNRKIKLGRKSGLTVREFDDFDTFHCLLSEVLAKFDTRPVHSRDELALLQARFPDAIRLFGAFADDELLAATWLFDCGRVVHTQYLASSPSGRELGALDLLLDTLIERYRERHYFSFGISTEQAGQYLNEGLIQQKEGFGGRGVVHDFYDWML